ncbi:hypothetical protein [Streptomyces sp. ALB3]|uniref:hypothetical protein n=1 Tax=Streptomyces sp. ALB3 TaxID=3374278 RepID=UPI00378F3396
MRSPARLVTGTAAAALTVAALGAAAPSAYADGLGRPEFAAATVAPGTTDCGPEGAAGGDALLCESGDTTAGDPEPADGLESGDAEPLEGLDPLDGPDTAEDPAAALEPSWPETDEESTADTGDEAGGVRQPGTGTGSAPGTKPGTPPGTEPGSAEPPVPPGHRPTAAPSPSRPSGHVGTGVGGSATPDTAQLVAGGGLVAAAAVGGALLLRRRRAGAARHYGPRGMRY